MKNKPKLMLTMLTSSSLHYLKICYNTVKNQNKIENIDVDLYIVVNTLNDDYYNDVIEEFKEENVYIVRTESNGRPGKGHNSVIDIFRKKLEYDFLFSIDGDDFLYPTALQHIETYILSCKPDILMLMYHDILNLNKDSESIYFNINKKLTVSFNIPMITNKYWVNNKSGIKNSPFNNKIYKLNTFGRVILYSRNSLKYDLKYDENCKLYDDFILSMKVLQLSYNNKCNVIRTSDTNIYLYNMLNLDSATRKFLINDYELEENIFRNSIKDKFNDIKEWDLEKIKYLTIHENPKFNFHNKLEFIKKLEKKINLQSYININLNRMKDFYIKTINFLKLKNIKLVNELSVEYKKILNENNIDLLIENNFNINSNNNNIENINLTIQKKQIMIDYKNPDNIFYINLLKRTDRVKMFQNEMKKLGWNKFNRFNAIKNKSGAIGCTLSHILLLKWAIQNDLDYIVVLEDDIKFTNPEMFKQQLFKFLNSNIDWDVLILGGNNGKPFKKLNDYCIKVNNCQTTTGYIVKKEYYETLINNYQEGLNLFLKNPDNPNNYAIDMYWKNLQKKDNWYMIIPATITQQYKKSDIEDININYDNLMLNYNK